MAHLIALDNPADCTVTRVLLGREYSWTYELLATQGVDPHGDVVL